MNCKEVKNLISPYIDGELHGTSAEEVKAHIESCPACSQIYIEYLQMSSLFKAMGKNITPAPEGFKDAVMQSITRNQKVVSLPLGHRLARSWKQIAASAAAVAILAFSGFNFILPAAVQLADNDKPSPIVTPGQQHQNTPGDVVQPDEPGGVNPQKPDSEQPDPNPGQNTPGVDNPGSNVNPPAATVPSASTPVFLSKEDQVLRTVMVKISTGDFCPNPAEKAAAIAQDVGAKTESLGQQVAGNTTYTLIKMSVDQKSAVVLINKLANLGNIISQEQDSTDISTAYTDAQKEYWNLISRYSAEKDPIEKARLEQKISSAADQLGQFKKQAEQTTIVLWLQD